jgi:hypothetical protein
MLSAGQSWETPGARLLTVYIDCCCRTQRCGTGTCQRPIAYGRNDSRLLHLPNEGAVYVDLGTFIAPDGGSLFDVASYQVTGNQVIFTMGAVSTPWVNADFDGVNFVVESTDPGFVGLLLNGGTTANGVTLSDASFTSNSLSFNFAGQIWGPGQAAIFEIQFAEGNSVPEPGTWAMMLIGFGAVGFEMRRRKQMELTFRELPD